MNQTEILKFFQLHFLYIFIPIEAYISIQSGNLYFYVFERGVNDAYRCKDDKRANGTLLNFSSDCASCWNCSCVVFSVRVPERFTVSVGMSTDMEDVQRFSVIDPDTGNRIDYEPRGKAEAVRKLATCTC